MEEYLKLKLINLYIKRAQCYMKMAERFGKIRYAKLSIEDCSFLRENKELEKELNENKSAEKPFSVIVTDLTSKADEFIVIRTAFNGAAGEGRLKNRNRRQNRNRRGGGRRGEQHNNAEAVAANGNGDEDEGSEGETTVGICSKLTDSGLALNALTNDDQCPICYIQWNNFIDPSIAIILRCNHACCATCLLRFQKECENNDEEEDEDERVKFCCVLCRKTIPKNTIEQVVHDVVNNRLISSFHVFLRKLPFDSQEFKDLVVSLLLDKTIEFDISKVEYALFNMIGLVDNREQDQNLNYIEKQKIYELARAPVQKIQEEYMSLRKQLANLNDTDGEEWKAKKKALQDVQARLNEARKNAAADIFERMNSFGDMGSTVEDIKNNSATRLHVDLHGLHINEAKEKINEFIMPILPSIKRIIVITGHGAHSNGKSSVLKDSIKEYFLTLGVICVESTKNKGALCVSYKHLN